MSGPLVNGGREELARHIAAGEGRVAAVQRWPRSTRPTPSPRRSSPAGSPRPEVPTCLERIFGTAPTGSPGPTSSTGRGIAKVEVRRVNRIGEGRRMSMRRGASGRHRRRPLAHVVGQTAGRRVFGLSRHSGAGDRPSARDGRPVRLWSRGGRCRNGIRASRAGGGTHGRAWRCDSTGLCLHDPARSLGGTRVGRWMDPILGSVVAVARDQTGRRGRTEAYQRAAWSIMKSLEIR
jgi:hypothetical protein